MKQVLIHLGIIFGIACAAKAQETKLWTVDDCMRYAVENSTNVKTKALEYDSYKTEKVSAAANFFPSIGGNIGGQLSYGRSIDPETNTYNNVSTFNNAYGISATIPIFNGGQLINNYKIAKVNEAYGKFNMQKAKDDVALAVLEAFVNVVYYQGTVRLAEEKLAESGRLLYKVRRMEELGMKGKADVAQIEAQYATDNYEFTHQRNLYDISLSTLKETMNYPINATFSIDTNIVEQTTMPDVESVADIFNYASRNNPTALLAESNSNAAKHQYRYAKGSLLPSVSFTVGASTNYFKNLSSSNEAPSFSSQFKNNRGEYLSMTLSLPIFSRLNRWASIRRARNDLRIAKERHEEALRQLLTTIEQAVLDRDGLAKETIQMEKKADADAISYQVTLRKYEEGLMSPLDLQTAANTLIQARANLLQKRLAYIVKQRLVEYYKGEALVICME